MSFLRRIRRILKGVSDVLFDRLPSASPELHSEVIGFSFLGHEIRAFRIGTGAKPVLFLGSIHGNEVGTEKLVTRLMNELSSRASDYPKLTLWFIPCLNKDGNDVAKRHPDFLRGGRIGRLTGNDVDLNRNFDTPSFQPSAEWNHGKSYGERTQVSAGKKGGSEPETQALTSFIRKHGIPLLLSFHSVGSDISPSDDPLARKLAATFSEATGYRLYTEEEWRRLKQTGTTKEWCELNDISFLELEASSRWGSDLENQKDGLFAVMESYARG